VKLGLARRCNLIRLQPDRANRQTRHCLPCT
jgi:hypothetical protein